jgi:hypothetical protein
MTCSVWQTHCYCTLRSTPYTADLLVRLTLTKFHISHAWKGKHLNVLFFHIYCLWYGDVQYPTICMLLKLFSCCQTLHYMKNGFSVIKRQCIVRSTSDLCYIVMVKAHSQVMEICSSSYILFCIWLLCQHRPGWCDTVNNYVREQHFIMNTFFHILNPRPFWDIMKHGITSSTVNLAPTGRMRYGLSSVQMAGRMFRY